MKNAAIILAAGRGSRLGLGQNKMLLPFQGKPLLYYSLATFAKTKLFDPIVVVVRSGEEEQVEEIVERFRADANIVLCLGGSSRVESVFFGLEALSISGVEKVLIHDGARPFVSPELILRVLDSTKPGTAAVPGVLATDSLREIDEKGMIIGTVDRSRIMQVQTPQGFMYEEIYQKHRKLWEESAAGQVTDDAQLFETQVFVEGESRNIKITTRGDYDMYNLEQPQIRVGQGFDVHRLVPGRDLILGGVKIPYEVGLLGHSDADVLTHAVMDAILGACGLGDIGEHFPDSDVAYKDACSLDLLCAVKTLLDKKGVRVLNVDATVLAEAPKIGPYKDQIRDNISKCLGINRDQVSIKATTTERLGFVGRKEGIAALAIVAVL